jgi:branched-chain amino acid transport system ATP-binding protein
MPARSTEIVAALYGPSPPKGCAVRRILEFDQVSVAYNGAIAALSGANGAGKTTLPKAAANLLPPERGRLTGGLITYKGRDVTADTPADHIRKGRVPVRKGRRCFKSLTIKENLTTGAIGRGLTRAQIAQTLEQVYTLFPRLQARRLSQAGPTSGGEQQMAATGRGLMARPKVFLPDEPSMGLAPLVVAEIFDALSRVNREMGRPIQLAEQNTAIALKHAHHATVIENGRSVLDGPASTLAARADIRALYLGGTPEPVRIS